MVIDPQRRFTIRSAQMESRSDFDPYEGREVMGWPVTVISRGEVIVDDSRVRSQPGRGRLLRRSHYRPV
jgi:dihydropyrimidinase